MFTLRSIGLVWVRKSYYTSLALYVLEQVKS